MWLGTSASAGASLKVGINIRLQRMSFPLIHQKTVYFPYGLLFLLEVRDNPVARHKPVSPETAKIFYLFPLVKGILTRSIL